MKSQIRKIIVQVDEVLQEGGQAVNPPTRRALAMQTRGQIFAAFLCCQGQAAVAQPLECLV